MLKSTSFLEELLFETPTQHTSEQTRDFVERKVTTCQTGQDNVICHVRQLDTWDCGIACLLMVIRWLKQEQAKRTQQRGAQSLLTVQKQYETSEQNRVQEENCAGEDQQVRGCNPTSSLAEEEQCLRSDMLLHLNEGVKESDKRTTSVWTIDLVLILASIQQQHKKLKKVEPQESTAEKSQWTIQGLFQIFNESTDSSQKSQNLRNEVLFHPSTMNGLPPFSFLFTSKHLGVDASYSNYSYYANAYKDDLIRVQRKFSLAKELCVPMLEVQSQTTSATAAKTNDGKEKKSTILSTTIERKPCLTWQSVIHAIQRLNCVAVVLVDNSILCPKQIIKHNDCNNQESSDQHVVVESETDTAKQQHHQSCTEQSSSYSGHYVILAGISHHAKNLAQAHERWCNFLHSQKAFASKANANSKQEEDVSETGNNQATNCANHTPPTPCIVVKNPGTEETTQYYTQEHLQRAWMADGTDQDVIFVQHHS